MTRTVYWFPFLKSSLKRGNRVYTFLISTGTSSQILGARWDNVSEPIVTDFIDTSGPFFYFLCYKKYSHWMEKLLSLSLVKAHSLFCTTQLQGLEYFGGVLKPNYRFLKVHQKMICYHYKLFVEHVHAICSFYCLAFCCETSKLVGSS